MTALHQSEPFACEDLVSFPDDGYRRELVERPFPMTVVPAVLVRR